MRLHALWKPTPYAYRPKRTCALGHPRSNKAGVSIHFHVVNQSLVLAPESKNIHHTSHMRGNCLLQMHVKDRNVRAGFRTFQISRNQSGTCVQMWGQRVAIDAEGDQHIETLIITARTIQQGVLFARFSRPGCTRPGHHRPRTSNLNCR